MARLSNILSVVKGAGKIAEKKIRKQLTIVRPGSERRMSTFLALSKSLKSQVVGAGNRITLVVTSEHRYGAILDKGTPEHRIPYSPGSGVGANPGSKYIKNLALWAAKKFYGGNYKLGLKAAFRIARKQKGITKQTYTNTGSPANPGWIESIKKDLDDSVSEYMRLNVMIAIQKDSHRILNRKI